MKTISEILKNIDSPLLKLMKKSQATKNLDLIFQSMLDNGFAKNCCLANLNGSVLTVTLTNASWATRLRYSIPDIIKNLRTQPEFKMVDTIRYVINQPIYTTKKIKKKQTKLSKDNEILWKETLAKLKKKSLRN